MPRVAMKGRRRLNGRGRKTVPRNPLPGIETNKRPSPQRKGALAYVFQASLARVGAEHTGNGLPSGNAVGRQAVVFLELLHGDLGTLAEGAVGVALL